MTADIEPGAAARSPQGRFFRRRWQRVLAFGCANLVAIALILEIALRITFGDYFAPRFFQADDALGHAHVPGRTGWLHSDEYDAYTEISAQGLRDRDYAYAKPDGTYRVLVLGDSFAEGLHVAMDESFEARLEEQLNAAGTRPVEVINAGVSRYGTDNCLLFLENEGLKYAPDLVIYAFYPNDVDNNLDTGYFHLEAGELVFTPPHVGQIEHVREKLYDVSYLYRMLLLISLRLEQQADETLIETDWGLVSPIYRAELAPREEAAWELVAALLARMQASAEGAGAKLLVLYLPEIFQSNEETWAEVQRTEAVLDRDAPNTRLAQIIPEGVGFLDFTPDFRATAAETTLYYRVDGHFNPAGHQLAADLIQAYLAEHDLIGE